MSVVQPIRNAMLLDKTKAESLERKIAMFVIEHNVSFNAVGHLSKLIKECANQPKAAANITCNRTKATHIVQQQFAPEQKKHLAFALREQHFSVMLDETTDQSTKKCLAIVVRYFDKHIVSRLLCLVEVTEATALNLYNALQKTLDDLKIPFSNIIGYGADNASTMMGKHSGLKANIFVMGCICHSLALNSSAAS